MEYFLGFIIASVVSSLASLVGFDKERGFYAVVLIVIASYYVLFAAIGAPLSTLAEELLPLTFFVLIAVVGFKGSPWLIVAGLAAHGVYDILHPHLIDNPGVPIWWPSFCLAYDLTAALYLAWLLKNRDGQPARHKIEASQYLVIKDHTSEYPEPITFAKGAPLAVGEKYEGPEGWDNWLFCETPGQKGGWVPAQVIEFIDDQIARAREDYTARELNVREGDLLLGKRTLNGWVWCESTDSLKSGWVPLANLQELRQ
jgi:hypothetical protein